MTTKVSLIRLFSVCCQVSALTFGGGYVIIPLLQRRVVEELGWLSAEDMLDVVAIAQAAPGAIAINTANLLGWRLRGAAGATVAILGSLLPPMAIIIVIGHFYLAFRDNVIVANVLKGMTAGIAAVILDVVIGMIRTLVVDRKYIMVIVCAAAFGVAFFTGVNVVFIIIAAGVFGALYGRRKGSAL